MSDSIELPRTEQDYKTLMEAMLKAFVAQTSRIDETTPLVYEIDLNKPAPELGVEEIPTILHYHHLYLSALFFPREQLPHITNEFNFVMETLRAESETLPTVLQIVLDRISGKEQIDYKQNTLTIIKACMLIDAKIKETLYEENLENFLPLDLDTHWGEAILGGEETTEVIRRAFKAQESEFEEIAEEFPDEAVSHAWRLYKHVLGY